MPLQLLHRSVETVFEIKKELSCPANDATQGCFEGGERTILVVFGQIWMHLPRLTVATIVLIVIVYRCGDV